MAFNILQVKITDSDFGDLLILSYVLCMSVFTDVIGGLTIIWFILWAIFVYDSPADHPRISVDELNFIEKSIGDQSSKVSCKDGRKKS